MRAKKNHETAAPQVTMRIPGGWANANEFMSQLPAGCNLTKEGHLVVDCTQFELNPLEADEEFPEIFAHSCPKTPTEDEQQRIENYTVNVCLTGPGGSVAAAKKLMAAAAAVMEAGGAGVFIDNSGVAHGATDWMSLFNSADNGGVYWAFIGAVRSEDEMYSMGMHILGFRDAIIPRTGNDEYDSRTLHSFLGFTAFSGKKIQAGETIGDEVLPAFHIHSQPDDFVPEGTPMFNPNGRWRLTPLDGSQN